MVFLSLEFDAVFLLCREGIVWSKFLEMWLSVFILVGGQTEWAHSRNKNKQKGHGKFCNEKCYENTIHHTPFLNLEHQPASLVNPGVDTAHEFIPFSSNNESSKTQNFRNGKNKQQ